MNKDLAVLVIHGMGSQEDDFADAMIAELCDRIDAAGHDSNRVAWESIYWSDILQAKQLNYFQAAKAQGDLDFLSLRKFMLTAIGDASAYQQVKSDKNKAYEEIHRRVEQKIKSVFEAKLGSTPKPMIILAHSLGGHIMSNYIWDHQHADTPKSNSFENMDEVAGIVTFGCNIPLFTFAYETVVPIEFPPQKLADDLKPKSKWLNFYDPDDVLGYPLKAINSDYDQVVTEDTAINVGGLFSSWNPLSHSEYWTDDDFTKPVAQFIASFL